MTLVVALVLQSRIFYCQTIISPLECILQSHPGSEVSYYE
jgi:hypothetical protein